MPASPQTRANHGRKRPNLARSERNARWIERYCVVPEGKLTGKPVKLSAEQRHWLHLIYDSPTRLFILSMGRKNAKTAFCAFLLLLHLCGPEALPNSQLYSAAQSKEQAAVLFELAAKMVRLSIDLAAVVTIRDTIKELICGELGAVYKALSAEASTSFGKSPVFLVHDELGQVKGPRSLLYEALETACAAQENPLSLVISTQAPTDADLLSMLIDDALTGADPRNKCVLYSAPKRTADDKEWPKGWHYTDEAIRLANPHFDVFMNQEEVRRQASDAQRMPSKDASYRNLILNQRVEARNPFVGPAVWAQNSGMPALMDEQGLYGGLDLSSVADLTALVFTSTGGDVWPTFWLPEDGLAEKSRVDKVPYDLWAQQGYLETTPGAAIQYEFIAQHLRMVFDRYNVMAIAFDRHAMKHLKPWLEKAGFTDEELERFIDFGQGFVSMGPAVRELEARLLGKKLKHGNHPVLEMCAKNAVTVKDAADNRKFVKDKATGRIDGIVALAMSVGVMPDGVEDGDFMDFLRAPLIA